MAAGAMTIAAGPPRNDAALTPTVLERLRVFLWKRDPDSRPLAMLLRLTRYVWALLRDLLGGELSLRAMSLVYTSLLSLVPLLALGFSVLKALGVHDALSRALLQFLAPLGAEGATLAHHIVGFVDKMKVGVLGSVGMGLLVYTAISLIHKVESSFNFAWEIGRSRGLSQRVGDYLSVLVVGPLLVFSALGLTASIKNSHIVGLLSQIEPFGTMLILGFKLVPYALMCGAFSFLYGFIPNTRVQLRPALIAGLFAGIAWQAASVAFATFVANASNYNAVYSGFAIVIFLLIWLYMGWLILLLGCRLSFYLQNPRRLRPHPMPEPGNRDCEALALSAIAEVGGRFLAARPPASVAGLSRDLGVMPETLVRVLAPLLASGILIRTADDALLLARDPQSLDLRQLWQSMRSAPVPGDAPSAAAPACELLSALETDSARLAGHSLRDWLTELDGAAPDGVAPSAPTQH